MTTTTYTGKGGTQDVCYSLLSPPPPFGGGGGGGGISFVLFPQASYCSQV